MTHMPFDLECGDVLGGRRLTATGIRVDGESDDATHADYSEHVEGKPVCPMVSLTYRITPALPETEEDWVIYATVRLDPAPDPTWWRQELAPGAERAAIPGAASTEAAVGPFAVPYGTERITIRMAEVALSSGEQHRSAGETHRDLGEAIVDLPTRSVRWQPAVPA